ncbi:hypothetical protein [Anaerobium acetethylicum]|uniref:Uncharacterized protein n=1 Tax=Anaerobium acetethylicum TaxID=1619234 RepID=A0A1D3TWV1_9FIRM|nr:hypothetical protein [Anaerobium acetethylicum]SCP98766.1 hypothetical protein SAMN05421730_10261 [Anaerobium acetethylicum]
MDEKEILDTLHARLIKLGYEYTALTALQQKHLFKIEVELSRRLSEQETALTWLKNTKINIASVSDMIDVSRKTIYNNEVLKDYIEHVEDVYNSNSPLIEITELREQLDEAVTNIKKMVHRDILLEDLKNEVDELRKEIISYKERLQFLQEENFDLSSRVQAFEKKKKIKSSLNVIK